MFIKYPSIFYAPQVNGEREWNIGKVSAQDGTAVRFDGDKFTDRHGNSVALDDMAPSRKKQIACRKRDRLFGKTESQEDTHDG